jgi:hypothetical protein
MLGWAKEMPGWAAKPRESRATPVGDSDRASLDPQSSHSSGIEWHGVQDGSVEYLQGMEFYNALRFLEKPIIFLSYPDEGHNLKKYENQIDFTQRLWQFLDHYLKGAPAPKWMTEGVPFLRR